MDDTSRSVGVNPDSPQSTAARARLLRARAEWCIDVAAKVADQRMFRAYVEAAQTYLREAQEIEQLARLDAGPAGVGDPPPLDPSHP